MNFKFSAAVAAITAHIRDNGLKPMPDRDFKQTVVGADRSSTHITLEEFVQMLDREKHRLEHDFVARCFRFVPIYPIRNKNGKRKCLNSSL